MTHIATTINTYVGTVLLLFSDIVSATAVHVWLHKVKAATLNSISFCHFLSASAIIAAYQ